MQGFFVVFKIMVKLGNVLMLQLLTKKWIFYFVLSFVVTFFVSFFVVSAFVDYPGNIVRKSEVFTASILPPPEFSQSTEIEPEPESEPEQIIDLPEQNVLVVLTEEQKQKLLSEIQEKLDLIKAEIQKLIDEQNPKAEVLEVQKIEDSQEQPLPPVQQQVVVVQEPITPIVTGGGGGGTTIEQKVYPKIIISEVQILPTNQRFIELYNSSNEDVLLTNWYLQRKTATGDNYQSLVTKTDFFEKKILANSYFIISRDDQNADILINDLTLSNGNSLILKNPDKEASDQVSWGDVLDGVSWCYDFDICLPSSKAQNIKYVEPPPPPLPTDMDAPEVVFNLLPTQTALSFSINFTITDISVTTTPSGLSSFILQWSNDNGVTWNVDESPTTAIDGLQTRNFTGEDGKTYFFQVKATDNTGNISEWLPTTPAQTIISISIPAQNMLNNEFFDNVWEGTASSGNPIDWTWGKRGGLDLEEPQLVVGKKSFYHEPYSTFYYLKQLGKALEVGKTYYVRIWAKGTGKIKVGIEVVGDIKEPTFYASLNNSDWTVIDYSYTILSGEETTNGGITLKLTRYNSTEERLVVGAAWLGTTQPPENWLNP